MNFNEMFYLYRDHAWRAIFFRVYDGQIRLKKKFNRMFSLKKYVFFCIPGLKSDSYTSLLSNRLLYVKLFYPLV